MVWLNFVVFDGVGIVVVKVEYFNFGGSFKDWIVVKMIEVVEVSG